MWAVVVVAYRWSGLLLPQSHLGRLRLGVALCSAVASIVFGTMSLVTWGTFSSAGIEVGECWMCVGGCSMIIGRLWQGTRGEHDDDARRSWGVITCKNARAARWSPRCVLNRVLAYAGASFVLAGVSLALWGVHMGTVEVTWRRASSGV